MQKPIAALAVASLITNLIITSPAQQVIEPKSKFQAFEKDTWPIAAVWKQLSGRTEEKLVLHLFVPGMDLREVKAGDDDWIALFQALPNTTIERTPK